MIIRNKFVVSLIYPFIKHKERKFTFHYEKGLIDDEVTDKSLVRQYIAELQEAVQEEVDFLNEKYEL